MKKRLLSILTAIVAFIALIGFTACDPATTPPTPQQLSAPTVTLNGNVASWQENLDADKFEISLDGNLSYVENTITQKTLISGQSLKVRAIGDGINYTNSTWSNTVTYTSQGTNPPTPTQLSTPLVSISSTGIASWQSIPNAIGYKYKINGANEQTTTALSIILTNGQSIQVMAVGDGTAFSNSNWSSLATYVEQGTNPPAQTSAPTYLGIKASSNAPTQNDAPTLALASFTAFGTYVPLDESLNNYLSDSSNALGDERPVKSEYEIYSEPNGRVYIQIWLNNPDQNTILSLKLNNVKYQTGGDLESFFIQSGNTYLNCVYVAVTIPSNTYEEFSYTVTEIEYVEGSNISQDGKSVLIDEDNDTVAIGLILKENLPTATISNVTTTTSSVSCDVNVSDIDGFIAKTGAWIRAIVHDGYNVIFAQEKLLVGSNSITFENLSANTHYTIRVFAYADRRDGNGVCAHVISTESCTTDDVLSYEVSSDLLLNEQTGKYYPVINVSATLNDASFSFSKLEILKDWENGDVVYSTTDFNGNAQISDGILCLNSYVVKIYYKNSTNVEQYSYNYVDSQSLDDPWVTLSGSYGLVDDAIIYFDFGADRKFNIDNLKIKLVDEYSKQYLAESAIALIENANVIDELQATLDSMDWNDPNHHPTYTKLQKLRNDKDKIDEYYSDVTEQEWRELVTQGVYSYEFTYGEDEEFFNVNNMYYVVLSGYQSKRVSDNSWTYEITADIDSGNGEEPVNRKLTDGWFEVNPAISEDDYLFIASDDNYNDLFYVDEDNVLYLEVMSRNNLGNETYKNLGYVNQIVLTEGYEILDVLWTQEEPNIEIDEDAWLEDVINAFKTGNNPDSVFPLGNLEPITFDLDDIDFNTTVAGNLTIRYTYKMYGKQYTDEHPYDWDGATIDYKIVGKLPTASIKINTEACEAYGTYDIIIPEDFNNGYWNDYTIEIRDANGQPVGTYNQDTYWDIKLTAGQEIRIKLTASDNVDYYVDGDWSAWFVCAQGQLKTPYNVRTNYDEDGVTIEWDWGDYTEKFVYELNGQQGETTGSGIRGLKNGDTFKVKAVSSNESYLDSDYCELVTVSDTRTVLASPVITLDTYFKTLSWNAVENAGHYKVYNAKTGEIVHDYIDGTQCSIQLGYYYYVKAIPSDYNTYCASTSNTVDANVKLDDPKATVDSDGNVTCEKYDVGARVYFVYVINDGDEEKTVSTKITTLTKGDTIKIKATCTGYLDSDWIILTY